MQRRFTPLPALAITLFLSAGGVHGAAPAFDAWPALAPLLAGGYTGACSITSGDADGPAAITVSVDGKLAAPGIAADLRGSAFTRISRKVGENGASTNVLLGAMYDEWHIALVPDGNGGNAAEAKQQDRVVICDSVGPLPILNRKPLAISLAPLLDTTATLDCRASEHAKPYKATLRMVQGKVTLDGHAFDPRPAREESVTIGSGQGMQYGAALPDGRMLIIVYDTRGKARSAGILHGESPVIGCGPDA